MVKLVQILAASFLFSLTVFVCAEDYGIDVTNTSFKFEKFELKWTSNCRTAVKKYRIYFENGIKRNNMYSNITYTNLILHSTVEFNLGAKYMFTIFDSKSPNPQNCKSKTFLVETPVEAKISASNVSFDKIDILFENCPEATHYSLRNCISKPCIYSRNNTITSPIHMTHLPPNTQNRITIEFLRHDKGICLSRGLYVNTTLANIQVMPQIFISHDISLNVKWEPEYTATIEYYKILITKDSILVNSSKVAELSYSTSFDEYSTDSLYEIKIQGLNNSLLMSEGQANIKDVQLIEPSIEAPDLGVCTNGVLKMTFRVNNLSDRITNLFYVIITDDAREPEQEILFTFSKSVETKKWIALETNIGPKNSIVHRIIGDNSTVVSRWGDFTNHPLLLDKKYHIIAAVYSIYGKLRQYQQRLLTTTCPKFEKQTESSLTDDPEISPSEDNLSTILITSIIFLTIVIIVAGAAFYVYRNKLRPLENFVELLPLFKEDDVSNNLSIGDLDKFLRSQNAGQTLSEEYKKVPWKQKPVDGRMFPSKNRYENVLPVLKTRVYLREMTNLATQYINANYIDVANSENSRPYIATQGPIPETFGDFWRMIWEQKADIIVMLTNLQEKGVNKCDKYWPDVGETIYDEFVVHCKKICTFSKYECRYFLMEHSGARREITQFHYTRWPDHEVPLVPHAVVDFVRKVRECGPLCRPRCA